MNRIQVWFPMAVLLVATLPTSLRADELISNGGFENGTYTATVTDNTQIPPTVSSSTVPVGWSPNYAFTMNPAANAVTSASVNSGLFALSIGNRDSALIAGLSQTFADVAGSTYSGSFWALDGGAGNDANAYLSLSVNGIGLVSPNQFDSSWTEFTFSFTGTGLDTLQFQAQTNSSQWFVDDVSVTGQAPVVPEPSSFLLLGTGLVALACIAGRKIVRFA